MKTLVIFLDGISVNTPYTFSNGFTLSELNSLSDKETLKKIREILDDENPFVLYKSVEEENYNKDLFDLGALTADIISLNLKSYIGVEILAASDYATYNIPNIIKYGITERLDEAALTIVDQIITNFENRKSNEKEKIKVALMYLNKSKICQKNINGNYEHAIFFRVALENCFDAPRESKESVIAQRASGFLDQFDSADLKRKFKRIYSQASVAVHSGTIPKKPRDNSNERKVKIGEYHMHDILVMSINKIIKQGFPDW